MKKAKKAEASTKHRRKAEKAGLPEPESSETSVSEVEDGDDTHWLNELLDEEEEDEEVPPTGGGTEAPKGSQILGGVEGAPYNIVGEGGDEAPQGGLVPPDPQEGEVALVGEPEVPVGPKDPSEPRPGTEAETEGSAEVPKAGTAVGAPMTPGAAMGVCPTTRGAQGAPSSQKSATPQAR